MPQRLSKRETSNAVHPSMEQNTTDRQKFTEVNNKSKITMPSDRIELPTSSLSMDSTAVVEEATITFHRY
jgi:hypothetical protein